MIADTILTVISVVITTLMAGVGIEMANNPPSSPKGRRIYRSIFAALGVGLVVVSVVISVRTDHERLQAEQRANAAQMETNGKLQFVTGTLSTIGELMKGIRDASLKGSDLSDFARVIVAVMRSRQGQASNSDEGARLADLSNSLLAAMARNLSQKLLVSSLSWQNDNERYIESYAKVPENRARIKDNWDKLRRDREIGLAPTIADVNLVRKEIIRRTHLNSDKDKSYAPHFENLTGYVLESGGSDATYLEELAGRLKQ
jgi:hypothetical protein